MKRTVTKHGDLTIVSGYEEVLLANGLDSLDALFNTSNAESLGKPGLSPWRQRLRLTLNVTGEQRTFYLKRFHNPPPGAGREVKRSRTGASSMAGLEWTWMNRFAAEGIPCVEPVAYGELLSGSKELRSAILTAAVPGESLERWAGRWSEADRATVSILIPPLAALIARLHERGYIHRDLYLSHIFYDASASTETCLHLIDLQRVMRPRRRRRRWIVKDLASLNFSAPRGLVLQTERLRWLTRYLGTGKLDGSARRLAYRIMGKTQHIAGHDQRRTGRRWARSYSQ